MGNAKVMVVCGPGNTGSVLAGVLAARSLDLGIIVMCADDETTYIKNHELSDIILICADDEPTPIEMIEPLAYFPIRRAQAGQDIPFLERKETWGPTRRSNLWKRKRKKKS